jgi:hypothetical protein
LRAAPGGWSALEARLVAEGRATAIENGLQKLGGLTKAVLQGPKGAVVDLAAALTVSAWAVARIGALLGRDLRRGAELTFLTDAFAAAAAESGEGAVAYESDLRQRGDVLSWGAVNLFGVTYDAGRLAGYLWSPLRDGRERPQDVIGHAARLLAFSLLESGRARVLPKPLRVLLNVTAANDLRERVIQAAINIGAREHLLGEVER